MAELAGGGLVIQDEPATGELTMISRHVILLALGIAGLTSISCSTPRRFGDPGGVPVSIVVDLDRAFVSSMTNRQWTPSIGGGVAVGSGGSQASGAGMGLTFSSTKVYVIGGDAAGQANVFRREVKWGTNAFTVPLTPGRTLVLGAQVQGGREGWESVGSVVIPTASGAQVHITMSANGGAVSASSVAP